MRFICCISDRRLTRGYVFILPSLFFFFFFVILPYFYFVCFFPFLSASSMQHVFFTPPLFHGITFSSLSFHLVFFASLLPQLIFVRCCFSLFNVFNTSRIEQKYINLPVEDLRYTSVHRLEGSLHGIGAR